MHRAVILDLGKTVLDFDLQLGYRALERFCPYPPAEIPRRIADSGLVEPFERGLMEPREFFERFSRTLELRLDYESFGAAWNAIFKEPLIPESVLEGLARRYRLLLLSNTNALHFQSLRRRRPLLRHFQDAILSFEVHAVKPDAAIFRAAIARAGCQPEECFYTDDIPAFAAAARALGMDAAEFRGFARLKLDLRARGLAWE